VPPDDERQAIEAALRVRPDPTTRNWLPGETVADLLRENAEHDVGKADIPAVERVGEGDDGLE
jgi:hypothetical protein